MGMEGVTMMGARPEQHCTASGHDADHNILPTHSRDTDLDLVTETGLLRSAA